MSVSLEDEAQAEIVVAVRAGVVVAVRNTTVARIVVPAATTVHEVRLLDIHPGSSITFFLKILLSACFVNAHNCEILKLYVASSIISSLYSCL